MPSLISSTCARLSPSFVSLFCAAALAWAPCGLALAAKSAPSANPSMSQESPWPYTVRLDAQHVLQVFPPQIDSWDGFHLQARAAVVMREATRTPDDDSRATYGTVQIETRTLVDKGTRQVTLDQYRILKADFPTASAQTQAWADALQKDAAGKSRTIALDRLEAQVREISISERTQHMPLKNDAPHILFSHQPAILVNIDGPPRYSPLAGTSLEHVMNTRVLLLRDASGRHYLHVFDGWLSTHSLEGPWSVWPTESEDLRKARTEAEKNRAADLLSGVTAATTAKTASPEKAPSLKTGPSPRIVIATGPTELIVSDGDWSWTPITGTRLLYVKNSTGNIFRYNDDQNLYMLISGRWFKAASESGPWSFVPSNALPADFAKIPDDSEKENVKASVAHTPQAREAIIAANVPQTAAIKISQARLAPIRFDGEPQWAKIEGTALSYAPNTRTPLIQVNPHSYYAMDNGVWFSAPSANGPWVAATSVPSEIYSIPPSSPLHYVTYVRIFGTSSDVVYEGYTSGYQSAYVDPASNVVVYGTGYAYEPWIGSTWIGTPPTYGYGAAVTYTPWTGWFFGFCFGWAWGAATSAWGWGWGPYPYWGPWAYGWGGWSRGVAYGPFGGTAVWGPGGWAGFTGPVYQRWGSVASVSRASAGFNTWTGRAWAGRSGIAYNSRTGVLAAGQRGVVNNVYTGRFAAGSRGVAVGPGGTAAAGSRAVVGNARTGRTATVNRGAVYNPATGQRETFGGVRGAQGAMGHIGNDVYAGHDGHVYRNTGEGWQQHTSNGWQSVVGGDGVGTRTAPDVPQLDAARQSRLDGAQRSEQLRQSSQGMHSTFGGGGGGRGGGFHGGGFHGGFRR